MRFAPLSKRFIDSDTASPLGVSPAAFAIRPGDKGGLSVTEIEYFGPFDAASRMKAAAAFRASQPSGKLGSKGAFAWAEIGAIKAAGRVYRKQLRVVHDPVPENPAHAEIRHFSDDDLDLLEHFATSVFLEYAQVSDILTD